MDSHKKSKTFSIVLYVLLLFTDRKLKVLNENINEGKAETKRNGRKLDDLQERVRSTEEFARVSRKQRNPQESHL